MIHRHAIGGRANVITIDLGALSSQLADWSRRLVDPLRGGRAATAASFYARLAGQQIAEPSSEHDLSVPSGWPLDPSWWRPLATAGGNLEAAARWIQIEQALAAAGRAIR